MAANLAILEKPVGIRTEHITAEPTSLRIKQHSSTLSSGGYTISDATSNSTLFTSDMKTQHWDARRSFYDAFGVKLFDFTHERRNGIWSIRLPEKEDDPVAKLFHRSRGEGDGSYVGIRFVDAVTEREISLSTRAKFTATKDEQCASSKDVCIYHDGDLIMQTKMINRYMARLPFKDNEWDVHVAQGVDLSFVSHWTDEQGPPGVY